MDGFKPRRWIQTSPTDSNLVDGLVVCVQVWGPSGPLPRLVPAQTDEKALATAAKTQEQLRERASALRALVSEHQDRAKAAKTADAEMRKELKAKAREITALQDASRTSM